MNESSGIKESKQSKKRSKRSQKALDKESKKKKKRKTKDPDAPKRPLGPYFYYFKDNNARIKEEHPELIQKQVVAKIAQDWKDLTDEQKQPYVEKSKEDKMRYIREKEVYDEKKRKEEEEAGENEENKYNTNRKDNKRKRGSSSKNNEINGYKRPKHESVFNIEDEREVRLEDIIGRDQISWPSDSEELAPYSPPELSADGTRPRVTDTLVQVKRILLKEENNNHGENEEEDKERHESKHPLNAVL